MAIDWVKGPEYHKISTFNVPKYEVIYLENGIKVMILNQGNLDIFKLDLVFRGGRFFEKKKMSAKLTSALMREGTSTSTSVELAEAIDFYGASMRTDMNLDHGSITISGITKHIENVLAKALEILCDPIFPNDELEKFKKNYVSKLKHDLSKNDILGYRIFTEQIFGNQTPYGYSSNEELLNDVNRNDLIDFYDLAYGTNNAYIVISGKLPSNIIEILNKQFSRFTKKVNIISDYSVPDIIQAEKSIHHKTKNSLQSSLIIGRKLFNRHHEDYASFFVLNTVLGGYFGSRLMTEIRENKGLTYDISSGVDFQISDGYFNIETDVDPKNVSLVKKEIYKQISILQNVLVDIDELNMVQNYLIGNFLNLVDGPMNSASFLRSLELDGYSTNQFKEFVEEINNISPERIRDLAQKYLQKGDLLEVEVGV
jgi:zinc protease